MNEWLYLCECKRKGLFRFVDSSVQLFTCSRLSRGREGERRETRSVCTYCLCLVNSTQLISPLFLFFSSHCIIATLQNDIPIGKICRTTSYCFQHSTAKHHTEISSFCELPMTIQIHTNYSMACIISRELQSSL